MNLLAPIKNYLDRTPMYMVVLETLGLLYIWSLIASSFALIGYQLEELLLSSLVIGITALVASYLASFIAKVEAQHLSSLITALLLFFLFLPSADSYELFGYAIVTSLAIFSKYILVWKRQHIFNPVAAGLVVASFFALPGATWWVASPVLFLGILILGGLVVAKIRRWSMVVIFILTTFVLYVVQQPASVDFETLLSTFFLSYPYLFLAFFMLTEPFTMPGTEKLRIAYAVVVGVIASLPVIGGFSVSPELALLVGNGLFFFTTLKQKAILEFKSRERLVPGIYEWVFKKPVGFKYQAGQYLEWMLPHSKSDKRGVRRYFTISSAPSEDVLRVAARVPEASSTYKKELLSLEPGEMLIASQLAGDFVLPKDPAKIGMIAGGIGVTPFVSQIREMSMTNVWYDSVFFYCNNKKEDEAYGDLWSRATLHGVKKVSVLAKEESGAGYEVGYLTADIIKKHCPDFLERHWYVSGPPPMVTASEKILKQLGVKNKNIIKDFFPGLA